MSKQLYIKTIQFSVRTVFNVKNSFNSNNSIQYEYAVLI